MWLWENVKKLEINIFPLEIWGQMIKIKLSVFTRVKRVLIFEEGVLLCNYLQAKQCLPKKEEKRCCMRIMIRGRESYDGKESAAGERYDPSVDVYR